MFRCTSCGATDTKWSGRCLQCGVWRTLVEVPDEPKKKSADLGKANVPAAVSLSSLADSAAKRGRVATSFTALNTLLGGGIVPGALILLSGEPGIGKSTLVAQIALSLATSILYVSGEESGEQIAGRMRRLSTTTTLPELNFLGTTDLAAVSGAIKRDLPSLVIVDSVQTMRHSEVMSDAGGTSQIRAVTNELLDLANQTNIPIIIIGHVTKDGSVAGPKTLEHLVDVVLTIDGERSDRLRFVRCLKNRFGPTDEVVVLEMKENGLQTVLDPSGLLLAERSLPVPGSVVTCVMDGNRPLLVEIQALTSRTAFGLPQRRANGFDLSRLQMLLAVLGKRLGLPVDANDVFVNVAGGINISEPAADLAVCMAVASAMADTNIPQNVVAFGEVGLSGEIRRVRQLEKRLREAEARGFQFAILPKYEEYPKLNSLKISPLTDIRTVLEKIER